MTPYNKARTWYKPSPPRTWYKDNFVFKLSFSSYPAICQLWKIWMFFVRPRLNMNRKIDRILKYLLFVCVLSLIILWFLSKNKMNQFSLESFDNITGSPFKIVPNTVHYIIFSSSTLNFISFLSLVSAIKVSTINLYNVKFNLKRP